MWATRGERAPAAAAAASSTATSGSGGGIHTCDEPSCEPSPNGDFCFQPGGGVCADECAVMGGALTFCAKDADCGDAAFCDPTCGSASPLGGACRPRCASDGDCFAGETCTAEGRCAPTPCATDANCPANFACGAGSCVRAPCQSDAECDGVCVGAGGKGVCYEEAPYCKKCI